MLDSNTNYFITISTWNLKVAAIYIKIGLTKIWSSTLQLLKILINNNKLNNKLIISFFFNGIYKYNIFEFLSFF